MAKVLTFSRTFPGHHTKKGQPTLFVEQILNSLSIDYKNGDYLQKLCYLNTKNLANGKLSWNDLSDFQDSLVETDKLKYHTIRGGGRFKKDDLFSPRVWFKTPYNSPQIIFLGDLEVKNEYPFAIYSKEDKDKLPYGTGIFANNKHISPDSTIDLAKNDGLETVDLLHWFKYPSKFSGQIICWNENINY